MSLDRKRLLFVPEVAIVLAAIGFTISSCRTKSSNSVDLSGKIVGWREDNRTGVSSETGLLKSWPEGGPALIWSNTELPKGHSSPAFGNNTIYLTGVDSLNNDVLVALDKKGKIKWSTPYGRCWSASNPESRCTPTIDGDKIYVSSGYGDLACIDANSGKIIWSATTSETYKGTYGNWGIAESLLIDGEKLYYSPGGPETMTIALNKATGDLIWKSESLNDKPGYVSPILIDYAGKKMWEEHWNCKGSIIAADGMLYIYDERLGNVGLVRPDPSKFDLVSSFKVKLGSGPYWAHPVIHNGFLYIRHGKALMVYDIKAK
jgi:outer membrane protein assembly factor BamB